MNIKNILKYGTFVSVVTTLALGCAVFFEFSYNYLLLRLLLAFGYISLIGALMMLIEDFGKTSSTKLKKTVIYIGIAISIVGFVGWLGFLGLNEYWNILLSLAVLYLLITELLLLGWTLKNQGVLIKIPIALALIANIFLIFIILFKVSIANITPLVFSACLVSAFALMYGIYIYKPKSIK